MQIGVLLTYTFACTKIQNFVTKTVAIKKRESVGFNKNISK